jgi:ribosomal protein L29
MEQVMKLSELRGLSIEQLRDKVDEQRADVARLGMQRHARRLDRTSDLGAAKKMLARAITVLGEKARADEQGAE